MIEELYIIKENQRYKVDLNVPSGITLSFKSNLFCDLSSISSSKSYTISLPKTHNNCSIFENINDIRVINTEFGKKFKAEFYVDGVCIVSNGNIYVESISGSFSAVMTWNVIDALKSVFENSIKLNELDKKQSVETGYVTPLWDSYNFSTRDLEYSYDSHNKVARPKYWAGVVGTDQLSLVADYKLYPLPVVPVPYLLRRIETYYGISFDFIEDCSFENSTWSGKNSLIAKGVIPCVNGELTQKQRYENSLLLREPSYSATPIMANGQITFTYVNERSSTSTDDITTDFYEYINNKRAFEFYHGGFEISGHISMLFKTSELKGNVTIEVKQRLLNGEEDSSLGTISSFPNDRTKDPEMIDGVSYTWVSFELRPEYGGTTLEVEQTDNGGGVYFVLSQKPYNRQYSDSYLRIYPKPLPIFGSWSSGTYKRDIIANLPSIEVSEFLKSLFFMSGAYPTLKTNGSIGLLKYSDIIQNAKDGNIVNISKYVISDVEELSYKVADYCQHNYYLMGSDTTADSDDEDVDYPELATYEDKYADGKCDVQINNSMLSEKQEIFKFPFYAPYIKSASYPDLPTGNTFKYWEIQPTEKDAEKQYVYYDYSFVKTAESKPCYGIISNTNNFITMSVWGGVKSETWSDVVKDLVKAGRVVKVKAALPVIILHNLDYSKPLYIEQLSSLFAVVNIDYNNEISTLELLKIDFD